ncbi:MAG: LLM class flavin-dependent oxidoreductase [Pseudomonadota bacterium]
MDVGLTYAVSRGRDTTVADNFHDAMDQIELAEQLGFAHAFVSEHHFLKAAVLPSPLIALSYIAARTERIKLGTGLLLLPLHNPVKVAEDTAVLDAISGGRLILGLGQGYRPEEFEGYERRLEDRNKLMREGIQLLRRFWTETDVTFEGEMFNYKNLNVTPKPIQQTPPIWVGAKVPRAIRVAADLGDVWYADPITPIHLIKERREGWLQQMDENGVGRENGSMAYYREFFVGDTTENAWRNGGDGIKAEYTGYLRMNHLVTHDGQPVPSDREDMVSEIVEQRATIGDPEHCIQELNGFKQDLGLDHLVLKMKYFGIPSENVKQSMRLAAEQVIPALQ